MKLSKEEVFQDIFKANYTRMYYTALYMLNDHDSAHDIVADVFADLWENFVRESKEYSSVYLLTCVRNKCLDSIKHMQIVNKYSRIYLELNRWNLIAEAEEDDRMEIISSVLRQMPSRTRFVVEQCYFEGKRYAEVAEILGITTSGVKQHIIKALSMLRNAFSVKYKKGQQTK